MKIYLMATPCSGKTTFAQAHTTYQDVTVVDFSPVHKRMVQSPPASTRQAGPTTYHERLLAFLLAQPAPLCVLGRRGPEELHPFRIYKLGAVLIPLEEHLRNSRSRAARDPHSRWGDADQIKYVRGKLQRYIQRHDIPQFPSFAEAIRTLSQGR